MDTHVILDLETFGNGSNPVVVAIGAVAVNSNGVVAEFYQAVDPQSCLNAGLTVTGDTILWWLEQNETARMALARATDRRPLREALEMFSAWVQENHLEQALYWGNGATADNVWMSNAYRAVGLPRPWGYRQDRCFRTLRAVLDGVVPLEARGDLVEHNALDDARYEADYLLQLLAHMGAS